MKILSVDFVTHYGLQAPILSNWVKSTNSTYFELEDTSSGLVISYSANSGSPRVRNSGGHALTIANYEVFLNALPNMFQSGKKRCDFVFTDDDATNLCFILGEIKDISLPSSEKNHTIRKGAKNQLLSSLQTLMAVPSIAGLAATKSIRLCGYFNKQALAPFPLSAATAFNPFVRLFPNGIKKDNLAMEALGFEFYEYTGEQTLTIN